MELILNMKKTRRYVEKDYGVSKRKILKIQKKNQYKICNTYIDWKKNIEKIIVYT